MDVIELKPDMTDPHGLREMLIKADFPKLARDVCDRRHRPWPLYVAFADTSVGLLEGRFDFEFEERVRDERFLASEHAPPQAWIFQIVVDPDRRREGIGSALINRFAADATDHGRVYVGLEVNLMDGPGLETRLAFFGSRGFVALTKVNEHPEIMGAPIVVLNDALAVSADGADPR